MTAQETELLMELVKQLMMKLSPELNTEQLIAEQQVALMADPLAELQAKGVNEWKPERPSVVMVVVEMKQMVEWVAELTAVLRAELTAGKLTVLQAGQLTELHGGPQAELQAGQPAVASFPKTGLTGPAKNPLLGWEGKRL